ILTALRQPIDTLLDLARASVQIVSVRWVRRVPSVVTETVTDSHGAEKTITYTVWNEIETDEFLGPTTVAAHELLALTASNLAFGWRDTSRSPRKDGIYGDGKQAEAPADPFERQTYRLDGRDPDGDDAHHPPPSAAFI